MQSYLWICRDPNTSEVCGCFDDEEKAREYAETYLGGPLTVHRYVESPE